MAMSYQEKSILGSLLAFVVVFGSYFVAVLRDLGRPDFEGGTFGRLVFAVIAIVLIEIAYHIVLALESKPEPKDERDVPDRMQGISKRLLPIGWRRLFGDCVGRHGPPGSYQNRGCEFRYRQPHTARHGHRRPDEVSYPALLLPARLAMTKGRIRNHVRKLRFLGSEMTQQQLAEKIGVTRQTVIAIEQDKYSPSLEVAFRIARVFGVPLEEVFQYETPDSDSASAA